MGSLVPRGCGHVMMALFASMAKVQMIHVPYKGGGPMAISLMSGETQSAVATVGSVLPLKQRLEPWPSSPQEFATRMRSDSEKYRKIFKVIGAARGILTASPAADIEACGTPLASGDATRLTQGDGE
jgi:Tripartite tricarboxylate transporter family receptor